MKPIDRKVLNFIISYKSEYDGLSPNYREIQTATGVSSTSQVALTLDRLVAEDKIKIRTGRAGGIMVVGGRWSVEGG